MIPEGKMKTVVEKDYVGKPVILGIRPEDIHDDEIVLETYKDSTVEVQVDIAELLGAETNIYASVGDDSIIASVPARNDLEKGSMVRLAFDMNHCHLFDKDTEVAIL